MIYAARLTIEHVTQTLILLNTEYINKAPDILFSMQLIEEIIKSKRKQKEKVALLAEACTNDNKMIIGLIDYFVKGTKSEKGTCMEIMEYISQENPELVFAHIDFIISTINEKAPRVKWESARIIGNLARNYPDEVANAVPKLMLNTKNNGTVVRWSTAFALTEIAKHNSELQNDLVPQFSEILNEEENSGVKKIYVNALKTQPHATDI